MSRRFLLWGVFAGLLLAAISAPAQAQGGGNMAGLPAVCLGAPVNDNGEMVPSNTMGTTFACVVTTLLNGSASNLTGAGASIIAGLLPVAKTLLLLLVLLEIAWIAVFDTLSTAPGAGAANVPMQIYRTIAMAFMWAFALSSYPSIVGGLRGLAVNGSSEVQKWIESTIKAPASSAILAARGDADNQAEVIWANYLALDGNANRNATQETVYQRLKAITADTTSCINSYIAENPGADRNAPNAGPFVDMCRIVARKKPGMTSIAQQMKDALGNTVASTGELLLYLQSLPMRMVTKVFSFIVLVLIAAVVGIIGIAWVVVACFGPIAIAMAPWRVSRGFASWWAQTMFALTIVPIVMSFVMGLWFASQDRIAGQTGDATMVLIANIVLLLVMTITTIMSWQGLQRMGGGALAAGSQVAKVAGNAAMAGLTSGASAGMQAFSAAKAGGSSSLSALGKGLYAGAKTSAIDSSSAMGGAMMAAAAGRTSDFDRSKLAQGATVGMGQAAHSAVGATERGVKAAAQRVAGHSAKATLAQPADKGKTTSAQAAWEDAQQAMDLGNMLTPGQDYTTDAAGSVALTPAGEGKMTNYRQANGHRFHATRNQSNAQVANNAGVRRAFVAKAAGQAPETVMPFANLAGAVPDSQGGLAAASAIAQSLPASVKEPRPGESPAAHQQRLAATVGAIAARSGGSWQRAQSDINQISAVSNRTAQDANGRVFGVTPESLNPNVEARDRQYEGAPTSRYESFRAANPHVPQEQAYFAVKQAFQQKNPQRAGIESDADYERRANEGVFLHA